MKRRTVTWLAASGGLVLVLAACSGSGGEATGDDRTGDPAPRAAPASGSDPAPSVEPAEVPEAFRFSAPALDGGQVVGADYAATGVALWFWAPW